jgi:Carboxypeptidase regulatory-like domain
LALAVLLGCVAILIAAPAALAAEGTGKIEGKVTEELSPGTGIQNIDVRVYDTTSDKYVVGADTNASGEYAVTGLKEGSYEVGFYPPLGSEYVPRWYSEEPSFSKATLLMVKEGEAKSGIDAELRIGGKISGTVTNTSKVGLEHIEVVAYSTGTGEEAFFGEAKTNANGEYTVVGLPEDSYIVEFYPEYGYGLNFVPQYYNEEPMFSRATPILVEEEKTRTLIDAELQVGGEISGTVTDAVTHKPVANVYVSAYETSDGGEEGFEEDYAKTNANGEYTIIGLGNGTYKIEFEAEDKTGTEYTGTEYITQYYNDEPSLASASLVTASQGSTTPGIDAALVRKEPVDTAAPVVSGTPAVGQTLSCSDGSWTGEPRLRFTHTWLRNGSAIANGSTYVVQAADQGNGLSCIVTATNIYGKVSITSNTLTVPVPSAPPPPPLPKPAVKLLTPYIVASGGSARVPISCANTTCRGTVELTEQIVVRHRHHGRTRSRRETVVLARGSYALTAGQRATIRVYLTLAGRNALARARHHRLSATARVSVTGGVAKYVSIQLSEKPRKHSHRRR